MSLEALKADADALGIKYRSDIKEETLAKRIINFQTDKGVKVTPPVEAEVIESNTLFKNVTRENIFTEAGRCSPGRVIELTDDEASKYKGLERC